MSKLSRDAQSLFQEASIHDKNMNSLSIKNKIWTAINHILGYYNSSLHKTINILYCN